MNKAVVRVLAPALVILLFLPAGLSAKERLGAGIIVTRLDGSQIIGELVAVKPDSLLMLSGGTDISVGLTDIRVVRIVRRSPTVLLTAAGFLLASGIVGIAAEPLDEWGWAHAALAGIGGAIAGLAAGVVTGGDKKFAAAGEPEALSSLNLDKLRGISREGRLRGGPGPAQRPRLRLGLATTMSSFDDRWESQITDFSWQFAEDVPSGEAGPHVDAFILNRQEKLASLGPVSLGYEWTERWTTEVEVSMWNRSQEVNMNMSPSFVSTADGIPYTAYNVHRSRESFDCLLLGLAYRPLVPSSGRKASVEVGIAAGPAWFKVGPFGSLLPAEKKTVLAARVHAAYDYLFSRSFSLGIYVGYRHSEASFAPLTVTSEMTFTTWPDPVEPIIRRVEMTVPSREFSRSGPIYGIRIDFRI